MAHAGRLRSHTAGHTTGVFTRESSAEQRQLYIVMMPQETNRLGGSNYKCKWWRGSDDDSDSNNINNSMFFITHNNSVAPPQQQTLVVKADSGTTSHYFTSCDKHALHDL
eukprot:10648778-Ditylum_brightwellii.AAC.1